MGWITKLDDGYPIPEYATKNYFLLRDLPLRQGDVIISTYPKCGNHWIAYIIWRIMHPTEPTPSGERLTHDIPFVDKYGLGSAADLPEDVGRVLATRLPIGRLPDNACAKYVTVVRNPFDALVSFFHFVKGRMGMENVTEDMMIPSEFFDAFIKGELAYGCIFDHFKKWYNRRHDPNVHLVAFENVKANSRDEILKLATFLGRQEALLENDAKILDQIVEESSFSAMKKNIQYKEPGDKGKVFPVLRKGKVGGYRESLTEEQVEKVRRKMETELEGTELLELWRHL